MPPSNTPPNLLLITSDQQHWATLGINNPDIQTPGLDRLVKLGTNFTRAYCPNPTCTPTRASIITGMYPSAHGAFTLGTKLPEHQTTLGQHLKALGYHSSLIGKAHFQPLKSTDNSPGVEAYPTLRDLDFWRTFNDTHAPWYGFDHCELTRNHSDEGHVGQHYAIWLEEQGLDNWRDYFQPRTDGVKDTPTDGDLAPITTPGYGMREDMHWKLPEELHYTRWTGLRTIAAIERAHNNRQPFFIWSSYHDPHPPYCVPEPWASMYKPEDMKIAEFTPGEFDDMPPPHRMTQEDGANFAPFNIDRHGNHGYGRHNHLSHADYQRAQACYYGMISFMDHWIGQTLDKLEALGILDNTLIVFTSDHGHFLGHHGLDQKGPFHYEDVIRVPYLAAWPGHIPAAAESDALQTLVDIAPTFLDAAGRESKPLEMQGESQLERWTGQAEGRRSEVFVENHHNASDAVHLRTLITDRYKLTVYRGRDWGELFDLEEDPGELVNLFDKPEARETRAMLMEQMIQADLAREPAPMPRVSGA
ncbi:MAG: sulfatase-like hydrolase/transferase [Planctomycetota bacterium]